MPIELPILSLVTFSPFVGILAVLLFRRPENSTAAKVTALFSSLVTFGLSLHLWFHFDPKTIELQFVEQHSWITSFGIEYFLGLDGFNLFLVLIITLLTPIALLASWNLQTKVWQLQTQILAFQIGLIGSVIALDVVLFYAFFEALLIPLYFIIGVWGGETRIQATLKFLIYTMVGSFLMLISILYTAFLYHETFGEWSFNIFDWYQLSTEIAPSVQLWLFIGFAIAFAIKVPLFPFHTWLPDAHRAAPTVGSVLLAAILLGPYGFLRFAMPVFIDAAYLAIPYLSVLSIIAIIYAGWIAITQQNLKSLVAYSSVSHMGYIILGIVTFNQQGLSGGLIQMLSHAVVASGLFLCIGMMIERTQTQRIEDYGGVTQKMPRLTVFFLIFSLAAMGLPGLNGFVGELLILVGTAQSSLWYAALAASGMIISAIYMLWMFQRVMLGEMKHSIISTMKDISWRETLILVPLVTLEIFLGVYPQAFFQKTNATVTHYLEQFGTNP